MGQGAIAPVIVFTALEVGASPAGAGVVVCLLGVGQLVGSIPAGLLTGRIGERAAMLVATAVASAGLLGCILATSPAVLAVAVTTVGLANAVWSLARQAYLTEVVPVHFRARALSTLGGVLRFGSFTGPLCGAPLIGAYGTDAVYWLHLALAALAVLALLRLPDMPNQARVSVPGGSPTGLLGVARTHAGVFRTLGPAIMLVQMARVSRQVVIPLWAERLGIDAQTTSVIYAVSFAIDMLLFYPAGRVMDLHGRRWTAVPSMLVSAAAHCALPLSTGAGSLMAVGIVMGIGNGIGSGVVMTLAADLAPQGARSAFLGLWRTCAEVGTTAGPLAIAGVTASAGLAPAVLGMGAAAVVGACALQRWIPPDAPSGTEGR